MDSFVSLADTEAGNERGMITKFCADALVVKMFIYQITRLLLFVLNKKATPKDGSLIINKVGLKSTSSTAQELALRLRFRIEHR